jgi:hypothetical protein
MIMDLRNQFANKVSVAAVAGTALIGDVIDLGSVHRDAGAGRIVYLIITVDTEIITGGAAGTVKFQFVSDAQAAIATDGSATVHMDTGTFATGAAGSNAALKAGAIVFMGPLPSEGKVYEEFLGILCVTATTTTTAGKINAFLTLDPGNFGKAKYPEGVN